MADSFYSSTAPATDQQSQVEMPDRTVDLTKPMEEVNQVEDGGVAVTENHASQSEGPVGPIVLHHKETTPVIATENPPVSAPVSPVEASVEPVQSDQPLETTVETQPTALSSQEPTPPTTIQSDQLLERDRIAHASPTAPSEVDVSYRKALGVEDEVGQLAEVENDLDSGSSPE